MMLWWRLRRQSWWQQSEPQCPSAISPEHGSDGVKAHKWRILVGNDAHQIEERVRRSPEEAYDLDFFESFAREAGWRVH